MIYIRKPFANIGDKTPIPFDTVPSGEVSFEQGYTADYQADQTSDPNAKDIERTKFNWFWGAISENQKDWQEKTFPDWISDKGDGLPFAYPENAIVRYTDGNIYVSLVNNNTQIPTGSNWRLFNPKSMLENNITVNVGSGGDFATINEALEYLTKNYYPMYKKSGITAVINLKAGFVMAEQVLVSGIDLGWITIAGEDAETIIIHTAQTTNFYGGYPAFGVCRGGTSPVIGQLFRFNVEKVGGNKHGLMAFGAGSSADVLEGKGFIGAGAHGIVAHSGSTINANRANASNAGTYGIVAASGSTINAYYVNASNAGVYGIIAVDGSTINANGAIIQNQKTGTARIVVGSGSHIEASKINTAGGTAPALSQAANTLTDNGIIYQ